MKFLSQKFVVVFLGIIFAISLNAQATFKATEKWAQSQEVKISKIAKDGDVIFQYFTGDLSLVIEEVQKSQWTHVGILFYERGGWFVYEAIGPVVKTPLHDFLLQTLDRKVAVTRVDPALVDMTVRANVSALKKSFKPYVGIDYDFIFQWNDDLIYCSELVYKMFKTTFNIEIGHVNQVGELDLSGPLGSRMVEKLLKSDYVDPKTYLDEPIVVPGSQYDDPDLELIYESKP